MRARFGILTAWCMFLAMPFQACVQAGAAPVRCYFPIPVESEVTSQTPDVLTKAFFAVSLDFLPEPITPKNAAELANKDDSLAACSRVLQAVVGRDWETYQSKVCSDIPLVKGKGFLYDEYELFMAKDSDYAIHARTSVGDYTCYVIDMVRSDRVRLPWFIPMRSTPSCCYAGRFEEVLTCMDHYLSADVGECPPFSKSFVSSLPFDISSHCCPVKS